MDSSWRELSETVLIIEKFWKLMEIWGFMSPDMRVKQGKYVPKNPRHEFFTPPDVVFFVKFFNLWKGGAIHIFKTYTKKVDVSAGKNLRLVEKRPKMKVIPEFCVFFPVTKLNSGLDLVWAVQDSACKPAQKSPSTVYLQRIAQRQIFRWRCYLLPPFVGLRGASTAGDAPVYLSVNAWLARALNLPK